MKSFILAAGLFALASTAMATDVGVSINIGDPNFYGRIDIGNVPQPPVIYTQPVVIERRVEYVNAAPIYLRVPPGHEKHWEKHCHQYQACGRPVYFVRDDWYRNQYAPRYHEHYEDHGREEWHDHGHEHGDDYDDRGHGHGHGHGRD
jgi:hypothetical protein